ncbi:hypothetical protein [Kribbella sp. NPDC051770]|uniref:hypothetical protein n=1 Tax=Kribbella sp. NPDC051770 TaxID=3155413 RepID=UPI00343F8B75
MTDARPYDDELLEADLDELETLGAAEDAALLLGAGENAAENAGLAATGEAIDA